MTGCLLSFIAWLYSLVLIVFSILGLIYKDHGWYPVFFRYIWM